MLFLPSDQVEIMVKHIMTYLFCWPSDPGWIMVNPSFYWWGWGCLASGCSSWIFWLSPTFMLGIWHGDQWLKRYLAQLFYGWVERGSPILGLDFALLMKGYFSLYFYEYYIGLYVDHMAMISLVFLILLCSLCMCFMTVAIYGSHNFFICKWMENVSMT